MRGSPFPVNNTLARMTCPVWHGTLPNLKSSGVLSVAGVLYWAVSCFNYGDDPVFNRQRYGPAWIITSTDGGLTWNETATAPDMFTGRLAAPRFIQYGADFAGAPSDWVYVYFPGTTSNAAFFENNDEILLARVSHLHIWGAAQAGPPVIRPRCNHLTLGNQRNKFLSQIRPPWLPAHGNVDIRETHAHAHTHIRAHTYTHTHAHIHKHIHANTYTHTRTYTHTYKTCMHAHRYEANPHVDIHANSTPTLPHAWLASILAIINQKCRE